CSGCGTVPSKKQPTRITQALPDARVIPRVRLLSESESKEGIAASGMLVTTEMSNALSKIALDAYAKARKKPVTYHDDRRADCRHPSSEQSCKRSQPFCKRKGVRNSTCEFS
ncbi:MAG: hypothetical protein WB019_00385, partial [Pseudolabrys sp.]